ncbi:hypothetical protein B0H14DRAFT_3437102 [Mycena olivaceomarginata]|nr:hypothetical protein B0H14DRAFT_3437102 [Mycena olivaceomarginata]
MLHKLFFTTVLAILVLGQGAVSVSVPQTFLVLCGCPEYLHVGSALPAGNSLLQTRNDSTDLPGRLRGSLFFAVKYVGIQEHG